MLALVDELDLREYLSFSPVGVGFFIDGEMHPVQRAGRLRALPAALAAGARAAGLVRGAVPACARTYGPLDDMPLDSLAAPPLRQPRRGPHLAPVAGLAL
jgi:hypothetical protein